MAEEGAMGSRNPDAKTLNAEQIEFEYQNMKRIVQLDGKRLNYEEMSDVELNKNQSIAYSFKFMQTEADKEFARKAMQQKVANARLKLTVNRRLKPVLAANPRM